MVAPIIEITADHRVENIERPFKVTAGPGAGKTHWLINHIIQTVRHSKRLGNSRKIACITYTNVAAETILERLGTHVDRVEVSTIHSFLYNQLVKPFAFLIPTIYGLDISRMDGHDEIPLYKGLLYEWKNETKQTYLLEDDKLIEALRNVSWQLDDNGSLTLKPRRVYKAKVGKYSIKLDSYLEYKKLCWKRGMVDHDDVLFFAHTLVTESPRVLEVLRAEFPYFFVDEFQDTNPIQTSILKALAEKETVVGVVGDIAQSIFQFQGAKPELFSGFSLPGLQEYSISDNHRCTRRIVSVLNAVRTDIVQVATREVEGIAPSMLVGDKMWALSTSSLGGERNVCSLSRTNITANIMREGEDFQGERKDLLVGLRDSDSDPVRAGIMVACARAVEYTRQSRYQEALEGLSKELRRGGATTEASKGALSMLKILLSRYPDLKEKSLLEVYFLVSAISPVKMAKFRAGAPKSFYEKNTFHNLLLSVNVSEDFGNHRTIHKAKGAQFDNVLLVLDKKEGGGEFKESEELGFLLTPDLVGKEEHRIRYVAISRARDLLFINIPALTDEGEKKIQQLGVEVVRQEQ